jgi:poly-gamma-glutamate synthesis protein (capsule biosynthesis protein)
MIIKQKQIFYSIGLSLAGLLSLLGLIFFITVFIDGANSLENASLAIADKRSIVLTAVPKEKAFYDTAMDFASRTEIEKNGAVAMITSHHLLAGDVIARTYDAIADDPDMVVIIGPNHFNAGNHNILTADADWGTPYGRIDAAGSLVNKIRKEGLAAVDNKVFINEHAITSQVAFVKYFFPRAKILPLILKSAITAAETAALTDWLHGNLSAGRTLMIASLDFSHNQGLAQTRQNDLASIGLINAEDYENFNKINVDSRAALYVVMRYSDLAGARFKLLENTNSAELADMPEQENVTSYITGLFVISSATAAKTDNPVGGLNFLFFGDLMLDRHVGENIKKNGLGHIFAGLAADDPEFFSGYDLIGANLEGAVTDLGAHYQPEQVYDFAFAPKLISQLHDYNFTYFNIANNHLSDQGARGIIETENNLSESDFLFAGCADDEIGDCSATTTLINGIRIGLAGFSMVYKEPDIERMAAIISNLAVLSDAVIVNMHWGVEYEHQFSRRQQEIARKLVDSGADIIIGHHPHVVQGMEIYKNKPIFYSLGNFIFDQYFSPDTQEELGVKIIRRKNETAIELIPLLSTGSRLQIMDPEKKEAFLNRFAAWSYLDGLDLSAVKNGQLNINN